MNKENAISSCPKCNSEMVQGFIPDHAHGAHHVGSWHEGRPKKSFWTETKAPVSGGIPIGAFRCKSCGYLELYSNECFSAK